MRKDTVSSGRAVLIHIGRSGQVVVDSIASNYGCPTLVVYSPPFNPQAATCLVVNNDVFKNGSISHISKQEIADLTGLTKESTIRVMKEFKNECIIDEENKDIIILNDEVLQKYADLG